MEQVVIQMRMYNGLCFDFDLEQTMVRRRKDYVTESELARQLTEGRIINICDTNNRSITPDEARSGLHVVNGMFRRRRIVQSEERGGIVAGA